MLRVARKVSQNDGASESHRDDDREMSSIVAEQIVNNAKEHQPQHTTIKLRAGDAFCDIKTINIQQVVRKFALKIFRDAGVNPANGKYLPHHTQAQFRPVLPVDFGPSSALPELL
jgi:hypothetical protein